LAEIWKKRALYNEIVCLFLQEDGAEKDKYLKFTLSVKAMCLFLYPDLEAVLAGLLCEGLISFQEL
jgi:hypothetical protein